MLRLITLITLLAVSLLGATVCSAEDTAWTGKTVVITGANRGLGLELARQLHEAGANVIGTARKPEKADDLKALGVRVVQLDVADAASVAAMAEELEDLKVDVLLNNAGIFPQRASFEETDPDEALRVYAVNSIGPLRVTQALMPMMRRAEGGLIMNMSSGLGSIANNSRGSMVDYRASKAALNMMSRTMGAELNDDGIVVVAMSPGWVQTDMGGSNANLTPEESVSGILKTLSGLTLDDTGTYYNYDGSELPW